MTDYSAQVREDFVAVDGTVTRLFADIVEIKTASGAAVRYRAEKAVPRLRLGQSIVIIARKESDEAALVLNRTTRKTLRLESSLRGTAMSKYVAGLSLYALGAVAFFAGVLPPVAATWGGLALFAAGLGVIVLTPVRDDGAYADAFDAFVAELWGAAPAGAGAAILRGSSFR
ncbi:hypothetical protein [Phaeospirillum tilakii]|uniref:Uncharacterized protein n=1 Tax=Phaeospirillum tilakii TaxID=741673 RepID=A0ABW5CC33_9PROT